MAAVWRRARLARSACDDGRGRGRERVMTMVLHGHWAGSREGARMGVTRERWLCAAKCWVCIQVRLSLTCCLYIGMKI